MSPRMRPSPLIAQQMLLEGMWVQEVITLDQWEKNVLLFNPLSILLIHFQ